MADLREEELQEEYLNLVRNADFDRLELALNEPNIFSILSIHNNEIRHSNFLGWLLNPKENHGLNDYFLKRFLREIFYDTKIKNVSPLDAETLDYHHVSIRREWHYIDLLIIFPNLVICIENKVRSKDHSLQLTRYKETVEKEFSQESIRKIFVYLTPYGEASSHEEEYHAFISYRAIVEILDKILEVYKAFLAPQASFYIQDYIKSIKRNLMASDTTNILAREIYNNHKKLLDFIFENKPNYYDAFSELLQSYIKDKGYLSSNRNKNYVRFISPSLKELVPVYANAREGWPGKEAFLFELEFGINNKLSFKVTSAPAGADKSYKLKISEILKKLPQVRPNIALLWEVFFLEKINLDIEKFMAQSANNLPADFDNFWNHQVTPIIEKVEKALLDNREELLQLKEQVQKS